MNLINSACLFASGLDYKNDKCSRTELTCTEMRGLYSSSWLFLAVFLLISAANILAASEDNSQKDLQSAAVIGSVYCDTCFQHDSRKSIQFIHGASVAVECKQGSDSRPSFRKEAKTNEYGEFKVELPFSVSKHVRKIRVCSVKLINSSDPNCSVASVATSSSLHLNSIKEGTQVFSAGFFTFKPLKQPQLCNQIPSKLNSVPRELNFKGTDGFAFPPPLQDPPPHSMFPNLPPLPFLPKLPPLPQLPPLPPLPGLPLLPPFPGKATQTKPEEIADSNVPKGGGLSNKKNLFPIGPLPFPPNPFLPTTPNRPPNQFQPPPSILPPNPLVPPPSPFMPFPPFPGLNPPALPTPSSPFPGIPLPPTTP